MARYGDRYQNYGDAVDEWWKAHAEEGVSAFDICDKCIVERGGELLTKGIGGIKPYQNFHQENEPVGDGSGWQLGWGIERPPYTEKLDNGYVCPAMIEWYKCEACNVVLVDRQDTEDYNQRVTETENGSYVKKVKVKMRPNFWKNY
jgi:hypothetical protein